MATANQEGLMDKWWCFPFTLIVLALAGTLLVIARAVEWIERRRNSGGGV